MAKRKRSIKELILEKYPETIFDDDMVFMMNHNSFRIDMMKYISTWYITNTPSKSRRFIVWVLKYSKGNSERKMKVLFGRDKESFDKWVYKRRSKRPNCVEHYLNKGFSEKEAIEKVSLFQKRVNNDTMEKRVYNWHKTFSEKTEDELKEINDKKVVTLETCIKKYGLEKGTDRWNGILAKKGNNSLQSIMSRGFSEDEALNIKKEISNKQSENTRRSIKYWLKLYDEETAKIKHSEYLDGLDYFSFEYCIAKYGKEKGLELFRRRQEKWQDTINSKSEEEISEINSKKSHRYNYSYWKFPKNEIGVFYALKISDNFIKIGITYRSILQRYNSKYLNKVVVLLDIKDTLEKCFMLEQLLKKKLQPYKITKKDKIEGFGWTETFNIQQDDFMLEFNNMIKTDIISAFKELNKGYY